MLSFTRNVFYWVVTYIQKKKYLELVSLTILEFLPSNLQDAGTQSDISWSLLATAPIK